MRISADGPKPDWSALETAFEHNAPETHSYLDLKTGQVVTIVDSRPEDEEKRRLIRHSNGRFVHLEPASSREQYRWMERFVQSVEDGSLKDPPFVLDRPEMAYRIISGAPSGTYILVAPLTSLRMLDNGLARNPAYAEAMTEGGSSNRKLATETVISRENTLLRIQPTLSRVPADFWAPQPQ